MTWNGNSQKHSMCSRGIKVTDTNKEFNIEAQKYGEHPELYMYKGFPVLIHLHEIGGNINVYVDEQNNTMISVYVSRKETFDLNSPFVARINWPGTGTRNIKDTEHFAKAMLVAVDLANKVEEQLN